MNKLLVAIIILLLTIIGIGSFFVWQLLISKDNEIKKVIQMPQISAAPSAQNAQIKKIAYIKNNSIWEINSDGTNRTELVKFQQDEIIKQIAWKNRETLSYISCDSNCRVKNVGAETNIEVPETENQIIALGWNQTASQMAYIYRLSDGQMKLNFKSGNVNNTVKNFFASPGRGGSLDDDVSIHFSPDDKHVLVTNTQTTGNPQEKNTIWVLDAESGKEILAIPIENNSWPTQAKWFLKNRFLYKVGTKLYYQSIDNTPEFITTITNFYNPTVTTDSKVLYWVNNKELPNLGILSSGTTKKFLDGYFKPQSLDGTNIVSIKAEKISGEENILPFVSTGLSKINLETKEATVLDSGDINLFAISP